jgi:hypothetical protein
MIVIGPAGFPVTFLPYGRGPALTRYIALTAAWRSATLRAVGRAGNPSGLTLPAPSSTVYELDVPLRTIAVYMRARARNNAHLPTVFGPRPTYRLGPTGNPQKRMLRVSLKFYVRKLGVERHLIALNAVEPR